MVLYLSTLIDPGTGIRKTLTHDGRKYISSGYIVFVVQGKIVSRTIQYCNKEHKQYIVYKQNWYYINLPCKPISGAFNKESLTV